MKKPFYSPGSCSTICGTTPCSLVLIGSMAFISLSGTCFLIWRACAASMRSAAESSSSSSLEEEVDDLRFRFLPAPFSLK